VKLTIIGATGGIGRLLLEQAVGRGDDVTAVVRDPSTITVPVRAIVVDLVRPDSVALESAFEGSDAVLSAVGPRRKSEATVTSTGTRTILETMRVSGVRRIVAVSAAPVSTVAAPGRLHPPKRDPGDGFFMAHLLSHIAKAAFGWNYLDLAIMEELLRESDTEWTVIRPPRLTDGPATGTYKTAMGRNVRGGTSVSRADVAELMLAVLDHPEMRRQFVGVAR
jgi:putative NADH-flavin reductase